MDKVNYRLIKSTGEIIAVFIDQKIKGRYMCYSLYDGMHFDLDPLYIRQETKPARGYNYNELNAFLINRGYAPEVKIRMQY